MSETSLPADIRSIFPFQYHSKDETKQKKATIRIYEGLQRQVNYFKKMAFKEEVKEFLTDAFTTLKSEESKFLGITKGWEDSFKGMKSAIDSVKKNVSYKKTSKENFSKKLNDSHKIFSDTLTALKEIEKSLGDKKESDITKFTTICKKEKSNFTPLYEASKIELARLENNIDRYAKAPAPGANELENLYLRIRKDVPHYVIEEALKTSADKDIRRVKNYNTLKPAMQEALLSCNEAEILGNRLEWPAKVLPKLNEYTAKLTDLNKQALPILKVLNDLQIENYSKNFVKKGTEKPDLKEFFTNLTDLETQAVKMHDIEDKLADIEKSCAEFSKTMRDTLGEISSAISKLNSDTDSLNDPVFKNKLDTQKKEAIAAYTKLQSELMDKHNKFCLDLNALNFSVTLFNKLINTVANITFNHEKAHMSYLDLRFTRLKEPLRENHEKVYVEQKKILEEIRNAIHKQTNYEFYKSTSLKYNGIQMPRDFNSCIIDLTPIKSAPDLKGQKEQLEEKTCNIILPASQTRAEALGMVWHAGEVKEAEKLLSEQNKTFQAELDALKKKINDGFDITLQGMCTNLTNYLNRVGQTLKIESTDYDANFTAAYPPESTVGNYVESVNLTV